jgi:hypothetical protein
MILLRNTGGVMVKFYDKGGRRFDFERRQFAYSKYLPERRSGEERRSGLDRRQSPREVTIHEYCSPPHQDFSPSPYLSYPSPKFDMAMLT